jgi:histone H3/H4
MKTKMAKKKKAPKKAKASSEATGFANARVERLLRDAGAFRVSADAVSSLNSALTEYSLKIAKYAVEITNNSGRKTVQEDDIKLAKAKV